MIAMLILWCIRWWSSSRRWYNQHYDPHATRSAVSYFMAMIAVTCWGYCFSDDDDEKIGREWERWERDGWEKAASCWPPSSVSISAAVADLLPAGLATAVPHRRPRVAASGAGGPRRRRRRRRRRTGVGRGRRTGRRRRPRRRRRGRRRRWRTTGWKVNFADLALSHPSSKRTFSQPFLKRNVWVR